MRAVQTQYGAPDEVLELQEVDQPVPNADEVLVRVLAASTVNAADWHVLRGKPANLLDHGYGDSPTG